jgi:two-component system, cell cycle sensor histidine kinase and response regulator CckA
MLKVLYLEDYVYDVELVKSLLCSSELNCKVYNVSTREAFAKALKEFDPDIVLSDYALPEFNGMEALEIVKKIKPNLPFIILTGNLKDETAAICVKDGAWDYVIKENMARLIPAINNALKLKKERENKIKAEQTLRESEQRYRSLFESSSLVKLIIDGTDHKILDANNAACAFFNLKPGELKSYNIQNFIPEYVHILKKFNETSVGDKQGFKHQIRITDERIHDVESYGFNITFQGKKAIYLLVIDQTEKIRMENKIIEAQKMDSIGNLAGGFAHDVNNLLGSIVGYSSLLLLDEKDPEKRSIINEIQIAGKRASDITSGLLAFGRRGKNLVQALNINNIVKEVSSLLKHSTNKNITEIHDLEKDLHYIDADPGQINQVIMNLCVNASEAMPSGGTLTIKTRNVTQEITLPVNIPDMRPGTYVLLSITDTGNGIPEKIKNKIFEPFFSTKQNHSKQGTGLGLSTSYGIIKNHGGFIDFSSETDIGTEFRVYFPKGKRKEKNTPCPVISTQTGAGDILIVDDEEIIRNTIIKMLQKLKYKVHLARNCVEAVEIFRKKKDQIRLVILDVIMPQIDGRDCYLRLKELDTHIKVLLITGYSHNEFAKSILDLGANHILLKPFDIDTLAGGINNVLAEY